MEARVKHIAGAGTYESNYGLLYKFEYTFDDGTVLTANHKTEMPPFKIGDKVEYNVKGSNARGQWGSVGIFKEEFAKYDKEKAQEGKGVNVNDSILYQVCLKVVTQVIMMIGFPEEAMGTEEKLQYLSDVALSLAEKSKKNIETL